MSLFKKLMTLSTLMVSFDPLASDIIEVGCIVEGIERAVWMQVETRSLSFAQYRKEVRLGLKPTKGGKFDRISIVSWSQYQYLNNRCKNQLGEKSYPAFMRHITNDSSAWQLVIF